VQPSVSYPVGHVVFGLYDEESVQGNWEQGRKKSARIHNVATWIMKGADCQSP
jgi:hypothetical protein